MYVLASTLLLAALTIDALGTFWCRDYTLLDCVQHLLFQKVQTNVTSRKLTCLRSHVKSRGYCQKARPATEDGQNPPAYLYLLSYHLIGFGGLGVACWPLVPKFAVSNPAEAVGFLGRKNPQHAFLRRGSKAVGPMS